MSGSGKVGDCARDMVGGCRRCGRVVCRVSCISISIISFFRTSMLLRGWYTDFMLSHRTAPSKHQPLSSFVTDTVESAKRAPKSPSQPLPPLHHLAALPPPPQPLSPHRNPQPKHSNALSAVVPPKASGSANPAAAPSAPQTTNTKVFGNGGRGIFLLSEAWALASARVIEAYPVEGEVNV